MSLAFDGSSVYLQKTSALSGVSNSKKGTIVVIVKNTNGGVVFQTGDSGGANQGILLSIASATEQISLLGRNASDTIILQKVPTDGVNDVAEGDGLFHHIVASWDLSVPTAEIYVDGTRVTSWETNTETDDTIDYTEDNIAIGANHRATSGHFSGDIEEIIFWPGSYIDLTDSSNLKLFISTNRTPNVYSSPEPILTDTANLGQPSVWYNAAWLKNKGTGGNLTLTGTKTINDGPNQDSHSAQGFVDEEWSTCDLCGWEFPNSDLVTDPVTKRTVCTTGPHDLDDRSGESNRKTTRFFL